MIQTYKLDAAFGPVGKIAGIILFLVGVGMMLLTLSGLFLLFLGALLGFTSTCTVVDYDKKRVKFADNICGIYKYGQWISVEQNMSLGIKRHKATWRAYSRSNRSLDTTIQDVRLVLYDANQREIMPILKSDSMEKAKVDLERVADRLGVEVL
jgi:hypothetical protein